MRVTITRDYNEFKKGEQVEVDERTARNLFKLKVATVDKMVRTKEVIVPTTPSVVVKVAQPSEPKRKSRLSKLFKRS